MPFLPGIVIVCATLATRVAAQQPADSCAVFGLSATSPYVLPYPPGRAYEVWQTIAWHDRAENGHVGRYAIDFKMPIGSRVTAARAGIVVAARDSFPDDNGKDLHENFVFIKHEDATIARYFHLKYRGVRVRVGERVRQGQFIAFSGNSGQTAGPHLHFDVQRCGPNLPPNYNKLPCGQTLPVSFRNTRRQSCGLVAGQAYAARRFTLSPSPSIVRTSANF